MENLKLNDSFIIKTIENLNLCLNDPRNPPSYETKSQLNILLKSLCERKVNLRISPRKCFFCSKNDITNKNSFSFPCHCSQSCHKICLHDNALLRSPNLSNLIISCPKCNKEEMDKDKILSCFQENEIKKIKNKFVCQICKCQVFEQEKNQKNEIVFCPCSQRFHKSCLKQSALDLLKTSLTLSNISKKSPE